MERSDMARSMFAVHSMECITELLESGVNPDGDEYEYQNLYEESPLAHEFMCTGPEVSNVAKLLVQYGADVNNRSIRTNESILEVCVRGGDFRQVQWHVKNGAAFLMTEWVWWRRPIPIVKLARIGYIIWNGSTDVCIYSFTGTTRNPSHCR